jgi:hypothetical protein
VLLPYASYLRVYEPVDRIARRGPRERRDVAADAATTVTLAQEQQTVLQRVLMPSVAPSVDLAGSYTLWRDGRLYSCAVDLALRSWLALTTFIEDNDAATHALFLGTDRFRHVQVRTTAAETPGRGAVPHIRSATWGVPRTWFLLVVEEEREHYILGDQPSVRFRARMSAARARLTAAHDLLSSMIGDEELIDELDDLVSWLSSFSDQTWLEVDYAGVAKLLGGGLADDASAAEIQGALAALRSENFARAGECYRSFVERWRVVNALERAN